MSKSKKMDQSVVSSLSVIIGIAFLCLIGLALLNLNLRSQIARNQQKFQDFKDDTKDDMYKIGMFQEKTKGRLYKIECPEVHIEQFSQELKAQEQSPSEKVLYERIRDLKAENKFLKAHFLPGKSWISPNVEPPQEKLNIDSELIQKGVEKKSIRRRNKDTGKWEFVKVDKWPESPLSSGIEHSLQFIPVPDTEGSYPQERDVKITDHGNGLIEWKGGYPFIQPASDSKPQEEILSETLSEQPEIGDSDDQYASGPHSQDA